MSMNAGKSYVNELGEVLVLETNDCSSQCHSVMERNGVICFFFIEHIEHCEHSFLKILFVL